MNTATETTTIREFQGGICEIEKLLDEPGRHWVKVRFDARGGGGRQFEVWDDEMPQLERDLQGNFNDMSTIVGLPLAPFKKAKSTMPKHPFKRKNTPAVAVDSKPNNKLAEPEILKHFVLEEDDDNMTYEDRLRLLIVPTPGPTFDEDMKQRDESAKMLLHAGAEMAVLLHANRTTKRKHFLRRWKAAGGSEILGGCLHF